MVRFSCIMYNYTLRRILLASNCCNCSFVFSRDGRIKREVENVVSKQQDKERKTFAEALEIKRSLSLSESEDPQLLVGVPPARHTEDLPEVIEDEDSGLEMKGSAVEGNVSRSSISNSST